MRSVAVSKIVSDPHERLTGRRVVKRCDDDLQGCVVVGRVSRPYKRNPVLSKDGWISSEVWFAFPAEGFVLPNGERRYGVFSTYKAAEEALGRAVPIEEIEEVVLLTGEEMNLIAGVLYHKPSEEEWEEEERELLADWEPPDEEDDGRLAPMEDWRPEDDDWDTSSEMDPWGENDTDPDY
jgi:hypothetical protein